MAVTFLSKQTEQFFASKNYLYRIITLDRFLDFENDQMVFVSPSKWSDPYEKAFLEANYNFQGNVYQHPLKTSNGYKLFAQCWTENIQTEAMWKVFAPNGDGVMIKLEANNLIKILEEISKKGSYDFYIGKALYEDVEHIYRMKQENGVWMDIAEKNLSERVLSLLLKKRMPFQSENEIRVMAVKRNGHNKRHYISLKVSDLLRYVEYLKFDPRMGEKLFKFTQEALNIKYPNLNIHKSRLYTNPIKTLTYGGRLPNKVDDELSF
jgi:hypothetical protein